MFQRDMRAIVLSVTSEALHGRIARQIEAGERRAWSAPSGLADVFSRMLDTTARTLETLADVEWAAVAQSLVDLLLTFSHQVMARRQKRAARQRRQRCCTGSAKPLSAGSMIPNLTPARVAQAEGISERYLQKLFEGVGDNFTHYLRERRLQRAWADLSNPAEAHQSISEIAYRYGFGDSAHFSRAFRHRFGLAAARISPAGDRTYDVAVHRVRTARLAAGCARPVAGASDVGRQREDRGPRGLEDGSSASRPIKLTTIFRSRPRRVHWGYFSRTLAPQIEISSGDTITIETLSQHASDDPERMIAGDAGAEDVFGWTKQRKNVERRGAGPMDASVFGRGAGEGFGVHICTGPVAVKQAQPGDVLEVRILDIVPRPSRNPPYQGRVFGSSVAAWWGYHYGEFLAGPKPREVVTIYEIFDAGENPHARALYSYRWEPQTDPSGVVHHTYDYPGVPVAPGTVKRRHAVLDGIRVPLRPHFGVIAVAPREADFVELGTRHPISAAISITGGLARARRSICRSRCPAHCFRSAIPMPPRATAN